MKKITVSKRTEAQFKNAYKYKNKSLQAFINALMRRNAELEEHLVATTVQFDESDVDFKHSMETEAA